MTTTHNPTHCSLCRLRWAAAPEFVTARPRVSVLKTYVRANTYTVR